MRKLFADGVTLRSDPFDPRNPGTPWAGEAAVASAASAAAARRAAGPQDDLDRERRRQDLAVDRYWAKKTKVETRPALRRPGPGEARTSRSKT